MKTHVIIGCSGTNSIPWTIAQKLLSKGDRVLITVNNPDLLSLSEKNLEVRLCDVTQDSDIDRLIDLIKDIELGSLTYSACTVQRADQKDLLSATREQWHHSFEVNVISASIIIARLEYKLRHDRANVLLIGSRSGQDHVTESSITYAVSKSALHHLGQVLSWSLAPDCVVNVLVPGFCATDRHAKVLSEETIQQRARLYKDKSALGKTTDINDIASTAVMLLETQSMTGEMIRIDAGQKIGLG